LDFDDIAGVIGAAPDSGPGETASSDQVVAAVRQDSTDRVMPAKPFNFDALKRADVSLRYHAGAIDARKLPLNDVTAI
jgi:hypothetical protein